MAESSKPLYFIPRNRTFTENDPSGAEPEEISGVQMKNISEKKYQKQEVTVGTSGGRGGGSGVLAEGEGEAAAAAAGGDGGGGGGAGEGGDDGEGGWFGRLLYRFRRNNDGYDEIPSHHAGVLRHGAALPRKVPVKVEPKVFFANERTYLTWLHMSVILATISVAIVTMADKESPRGYSGKIYGLVLMPVSIGFAIYAMHQYLRRTAMLMRRDPGPYDDRVGPTVLGVLLVCAIVTNFSVKLFEINEW